MIDDGYSASFRVEFTVSEIRGLIAMTIIQDQEKCDCPKSEECGPSTNVRDELIPLHRYSGVDCSTKPDWMFVGEMIGLHLAVLLSSSSCRKSQTFDLFASRNFANWGNRQRSPSKRTGKRRSATD